MWEVTRVLFLNQTIGWAQQLQEFVRGTPKGIMSCLQAVFPCWGLHFENVILQVTVTVRAASAALVRSAGGHHSLPKDFLLCDGSILLSSYLTVCLSPLVPSRIPCPVSDRAVGVVKSMVP